MAKSTRSQICPHLGLKSDPSTALHFASLGNYCYHVAPPEVVKDSHQNEFCLVGGHTQCPIFQLQEIKRMPRKYRARKGSEQKKRVSIGTIPVVIILVLLVLAAFLVPEMLGPDGLFNRASGGTVTDASPTADNPLMVLPTREPTNSGLRPFCQPPPTWRPYAVTAVDTFQSLSRTYARTVEELMVANCRMEEEDLAVGDIIYLPALPTETPTLTSTVTLTPTRIVRTYFYLLPTWTGTYEIIRWTDTPTPEPPTETPVPPTDSGPTPPPG